MKWMIASDIHGSAYWCRRLLEAFEREGADRLVLLGDLLYHGPRNALPEEYVPMDVAAMLNGYKERILAVRGNCDAEIDQMVLEFPMMADYAVMDVGGRMIFVTHGHLYNSDALPPLAEDGILLHGHTHVPVCQQKEDHLFLNPGSAALPKNGAPHGYMTLCGGELQWKDMDGEVYITHIL